MDASDRGLTIASSSRADVWDNLSSHGALLKRGTLGKTNEMGDSMRDEAKTAALDAIHEEALRLLSADGLTDEVKRGLELIVSMARYQADVRNEAERAAD